MKKFNYLFLIIVASVALGASAQTTLPSNTPGPTAQTNVGPTAPKPPASINQRKTNQQDRVAQGLDSGQLTARETRKVETKEAGLANPRPAAEQTFQPDLSGQAQLGQSGAARHGTE